MENIIQIKLTEEEKEKISYTTDILDTIYTYMDDSYIQQRQAQYDADEIYTYLLLCQGLEDTEEITLE